MYGVDSRPLPWGYVGTWFLALPVGHALLAPLRPPRLHFGANGTFRVLQLTDLHFTSVDRPQFGRTLQWLDRVLTAERPHLVVLTGDVISGSSLHHSGMAWDAVQAIWTRSVTGLPCLACVQGCLWVSWRVREMSRPFRGKGDLTIAAAGGGWAGDGTDARRRGGGFGEMGFRAGPFVLYNNG